MILTEYAALSRGGQDWTDAFRAAVGALVARGGGELLVPAGVFRTGPIRLFSHVTLRLLAGAVVRFHPEADAYPLIDGEFEGIPGRCHMPCLYAEAAESVRIVGEGVLDGNGGLWWAAKGAGTLAHPRPYLVCFCDCERVAVEGIRLVNSPCWTIHPLRCRDVTVRGVRIENPPDSPNTDGINPNGCSQVRITDCFLDVGDDCIAIKSGTEDTPNARPCENIRISGCTMARGHGGVVIGSEMHGGVRNVVVTDCVMRHTDRGIRVKTRRGRGGIVENLRFENIVMDDVACPFVFNMYYFCGKGGRDPRVQDKRARPVGPDTPAICDIHIARVRVRGATSCAGFFHGLPERPIERVTLSDCTVSMRPGKPGDAAMLEGVPPMEAAGFFLRNARDITLDRVRVLNATGTLADVDPSVERLAGAPE